MPPGKYDVSLVVDIVGSFTCHDKCQPLFQHLSTVKRHIDGRGLISQETNVYMLEKCVAQWVYTHSYHKERICIFDCCYTFQIEIYFRCFVDAMRSHLDHYLYVHCLV